MIYKKQFQTNLLTWYDQHKRIMPWRDHPTPYRVWISEIMLQQTRVEAVQPYFLRFLEAFPTLKDLADAKLDDVLKLWQGLGYYNRARYLHKAANQVVYGLEGIIPSTKSELMKLPGIGEYTSGAIASIAFNKQQTAVDGNVYRVFARLLAIKTSIKDKDTKKIIKQTVTSLLSNDRPGDFNQALMELGATICLPNGTPKCGQCPVKTVCLAKQKGLETLIPIKQKTKQRPIYKKTVLLLRYKNLYAINKRQDTGLLASLYEFPMLDEHQSIKEIKQKFHTNTVRKLDDSKHIFSHLEWNMVGYEIGLNKMTKKYQYVSKEEIIHKYSIPTAFKTYLKEVLSSS